MVEEKIIEEFAQLHKSTARNKTARLRDLYEQIEGLRSRGFSHTTIFKAMKKHGLKFTSVKSFEVTFYRIQKERAKKIDLTAGVLTRAGPEEWPRNERTATEKAQELQQHKGHLPTNQATQEELKAITRSNIDINQFLDE